MSGTRWSVLARNNPISKYIHILRPYNTALYINLGVSAIMFKKGTRNGWRMSTKFIICRYAVCYVDQMIWGPPGCCRHQMGPMLAPWILLSGWLLLKHLCDRSVCCVVLLGPFRIVVFYWLLLLPRWRSRLGTQNIDMICIVTHWCDGC